MGHVSRYMMLILAGFIAIAIEDITCYTTHVVDLDTMGACARLTGIMLRLYREMETQLL